MSKKTPHRQPQAATVRPVEATSLDVKAWSGVSVFICQYGKRSDLVGGRVVDLNPGVDFCFQQLDFERSKDTDGVHLIINR